MLLAGVGLAGPEGLIETGEGEAPHLSFGGSFTKGFGQGCLGRLFGGCRGSGGGKCSTTHHLLQRPWLHYIPVVQCNVFSPVIISSSGGRLFCPLINVAFQLRDVSEEDGGFCLVRLQRQHTSHCKQISLPLRVVWAVCVGGLSLIHAHRIQSLPQPKLRTVGCFRALVHVMPEAMMLALPQVPGAHKSQLGPGAWPGPGSEFTMETRQGIGLSIDQVSPSHSQHPESEAHSAALALCCRKQC